MFVVVEGGIRKSDDRRKSAGTGRTPLRLLHGMEQRLRWLGSLKAKNHESKPFTLRVHLGTAFANTGFMWLSRARYAECYEGRESAEEEGESNVVGSLKRFVSYSNIYQSSIECIELGLFHSYSYPW